MPKFLENLGALLALILFFVLDIAAAQAAYAGEIVTVGGWTGPVCDAQIQDGCIPRRDYLRQKPSAPVQHAVLQARSVVAPAVASQPTPQTSVPYVLPARQVQAASSETSSDVILYGTNKTVKEATIEEIAASVAPRLEHYYQEVTHPPEQQHPAAQAPVQQSPTVTATNGLQPQRIAVVGNRQFDKLALYNLTPPLNTVSADGPSAADEKRIEQIALICMQNHLSAYQCREMQTNYLRTANPLIAAAYENMARPQQRYRVEPDGRIVQNTYIYYPQPNLPLSSYEQAQVWAELRAGKAPSGANTDPRIVQFWRQYCQTNHCASA